MRLRTSIFALAVPLLACVTQTAYAQTNKGAVAIEDTTAFESNMLGTAPGSRQIQIKRGEIFSLGRLLPLPDFHHTIRDKGLMRVYYIQNPGSRQLQRHIWLPEKSVKEFDANNSLSLIGKATFPWTSEGPGLKWDNFLCLRQKQQFKPHLAA
jgi:hypothetical protein